MHSVSSSESILLKTLSSREISLLNAWTEISLRFETYAFCFQLRIHTPQNPIHGEVLSLMHGQTSLYFLKRTHSVSSSESIPSKISPHREIPALNA